MLCDNCAILGRDVEMRFLETEFGKDWFLCLACHNGQNLPHEPTEE